jgi:predicted amidohydrolase
MHGDPPPAPISLYSRQVLLSRAFASQGACFVACVGGLRAKEHIPSEFSDLNSWDTNGGSCIIDPRGEVLVGPVTGDHIIVAECSAESIFAAKVACDVAGHYSRPDLFKVWVNRDSSGKTVFSDQPVPADPSHGLPHGDHHSVEVA